MIHETTGSPPAPIDIYLDSGMWNFLSDNRLDLCVELPPDEFRILITPEVRDEIDPIDPILKPGLKEFALGVIERCGVETAPHFGFRNDNPDPAVPLSAERERRKAGFGVGVLRSKAEAKFEAEQIAQRGEYGPPRKPNMTVSPDEADISVGARSFRAVVLSLDEKKNKTQGPINDALAARGKVIFLNDFPTAGLSLRDFILQRL